MPAQRGDDVRGKAASRQRVDGSARLRRDPIKGVGAAIGNAIYHATGRRVRDLPITQDKLL